MQRKYEYVTTGNLQMNQPKHNLFLSNLSDWHKFPGSERNPFHSCWEGMKNSLLEKGYTLYRGQRMGPGRTNTLIQPNGVPIPQSSFGLFGVRPGEKHDFFQDKAVAIAARDRFNRDVVIKVIRHGEEGRNEEETLRYLNSGRLRLNSANLTVPVLDFIEVEDWTFAVMARWTESTELDFYTVGEALVFVQQALFGVAFLHSILIAHLDVSPENLLINFHGKQPLAQRAFLETPKFRDAFPAIYAFIDFGKSVRFPPDSDPGIRLVQGPVNGRYQRAPEMLESKLFDPFAADVYMTARLIYCLLKPVVPCIHNMLELLQEMSDTQPEKRITAVTASEKLEDVLSELPDDLLNTRYPKDYYAWYHPIPAPALRISTDIANI